MINLRRSHLFIFQVTYATLKCMKLLTAGLERTLRVAEGVRVMLRRNICTKSGLVNSSLGTVAKVKSKQLMVKFDHLPEPVEINRVRSKFQVLKKFYVYRTQYPLILAYAVTIHKCQGLSLNCAIIDLSNNVFSSGMAYVALSRGYGGNRIFYINF